MRFVIHEVRGLRARLGSPGRFPTGFRPGLRQAPSGCHLAHGAAATGSRPARRGAGLRPDGLAERAAITPSRGVSLAAHGATLAQPTVQGAWLPRRWGCRSFGTAPFTIAVGQKPIDSLRCRGRRPRSRKSARHTSGALRVSLDRDRLAQRLCRSTGSRIAGTAACSGVVNAGQEARHSLDSSSIFLTSRTIVVSVPRPRSPG